MFCSPARFDQSKKENTCMSVDELKSLARDFNITHGTKGKIKVTNNKRKLIKQFKEKLGKTCGEAEHCWVQQDFVSTDTKKNILSKAFRPLKPREWYNNRQTWLNTYDILKVMKQYEEKYKDLWFLGVFPIDFASKDKYGLCVASEMCDFDIAKIIPKGKTRLAMILNLDRHDQSGSHWVALYCGLDPKKPNFGIYYYDSVAYPPPKEVAVFMKTVEKQVGKVYGKDVLDKFALRYNKVQKQFDNYDCGVFAEVFITQILKRLSFDEICRRMKTDKQINQLRDILYTPSNINK